MVLQSPGILFGKEFTGAKQKSKLRLIYGPEQLSILFLKTMLSYTPNPILSVTTPMLNLKNPDEAGHP